MKTRRLSSILTNMTVKYLLIDTRSWYDFQKGHLPTAIWIPAERFGNYTHLLPTEKNRLIIFYGEGATSDKALKAAKMAERSGQKNVKVYIFGIFAWKRDKQPVVVDNTWLIKNLDPHKVIIDVREREKSIISHIQNGVSIESAKIIRLGNEYRRRDADGSYKVSPGNRILTSLSDKNAHIILYGNHSESNDVLSAYRELLNWGYRKVVILAGGYSAWEGKYAVKKEPARTSIRYKRYVAEGSVTAKQFKKLQSV